MKGGGEMTNPNENQSIALYRDIADGIAIKRWYGEYILVVMKDTLVRVYEDGTVWVNGEKVDRRRDDG